MSEFWWALSMLTVGGIGGGIIGYHAGLKRSSEALWEVCEDMAKSAPVREATIEECINELKSAREVTKWSQDGLYKEDLDQALLLRNGVEIAIEALRKMDK
jgi:hypothetical protein